VKTAILFPAIVILIVDVVASLRVGRSGALSWTQKAAWLVLIWLAPLLGGILAFSVCGETDSPAPVAGQLGDPPDPGYEPTKTTML
jgi:hypothetical protein